jgi:hypothetical protein
MRRILPILPLLAACAQQPSGPPPGAWIGRSEADLVAALGVPTRSAGVEGRRFLTYETEGASRPQVVPSFGLGFGRLSGGWGSAAGFGTGVGIGVGSGSSGCVTTFEVQEGRVVGAVQAGGCG